MEMALTRTTVRLFLRVAVLFKLCHSDVTCRNDQGQEVDWFILYKLPKSTGDGLTYLYMDQTTRGWKASKYTINSSSGTMANTLRPLLDYYKRKTEGFGYILYNDQPPKPFKPVSPSFGHSKGVVMLNKTTGVWLSHSTPNFPTYRNEDFWPSSGNINAQTFLCVTYPYSEFKNIGVQLKYIHPYSYDFEMPPTFHTELKCVAQNNCYPKTKPWFSVKSLTSRKGLKFQSIAKYSRFGDDLYSGLIVNFASQDIFAKSWGTMRQPLPSNCSETIPHFVYNVKEINPNRRVPFTDTVDHSKWCVTRSGDFTCIADMNREVSQMGRGGGAICINDPKVGSAFFLSINKYQPCETSKRGRL